MEYTVKKLAQLSGVSSRTLRYYDQIGLLSPLRLNASGYRVYGPDEVDRLQQILFYRELGVTLAGIGELLGAPAFNRRQTLCEHRRQLLKRREQLDALLANVTKTIETLEGRIVMTDKEKFEGFKQTMIDDNEQKYGREIRGKYGDEPVDRSNQKLRNMTPEAYARMEQLSERLLRTLSLAFETGDPSGVLAQQAAQLHREWLCCTWDSYSKQAHAGLAQMYVDDARFTAYYDREKPGTAQFLRDAILIYTGAKQ